MQIRRSGFTLVELLVVIAIISVLAALLIPALQGAVATARDATCQSNQKQVSLAVFFYADDWAGALPMDHGQAPWISWIDRVGATPGRTGGALYPWSDEVYQSGYINYVRKTNVLDAWKCSSAWAQLPSKSYSCYSFNSAMMKRRLSRIKGAKVLLGDGMVGSNTLVPEDMYFWSSMTRNGWGTQDRGYYPWPLASTTNIWGAGIPMDYRGHGQGVAQLSYTDGHVEGMTRDEIDSAEGLAIWSFP